MKKVNIIFGLAFIILIFALIIPNNVMAVDADINSDVTTMQTTESATITANISDTETWSLRFTTNGGELSGTTAAADAAGSEVSQNVLNAKFTATEAGTYTITLSGEIANSDMVTNKEKKSISKSITIKVVNPVEEEKPSEPEQTSENNEQEQQSEDNPSEQQPSDNTSETETPAVVKSSDASLKELTAQTTNSSLSVTKDGTKYSATVESNINAVTFTVEAGSDKATIDSNRSTSGIGFIKNSGSGNKKTYTMSNLKEGNNVIKITIEAEDGTQRNYNFVVTRKVVEKAETKSDEPVTITPNIDEKPIDNSEPQKAEEDKDELGLKTLVITGVQLSPKFDSRVYEYTASVEGSDSVEIIATPMTDGANVEIVGNKNLVNGENLITILVKKDEDTKTYQIILTKTEKKLTTETSVAASTDDSGFSWKYIAIIAVAVIIVIIVTIRLMSMSKKTIDNDFYDKPSKLKKKKESTIYDELEKDDEDRKGRRFK